MENRKRRNERFRIKERKKKAHKEKCKKYLRDRIHKNNLVLFRNLEQQIKNDVSYNEIICNLYLCRDRLNRDIRSQNLILNQCKIDQSEPFEYYHLSKFDIPDKKEKSWNILQYF